MLVARHRSGLVRVANDDAYLTYAGTVHLASFQDLQRVANERLEPMLYAVSATGGYRFVVLDRPNGAFSYTPKPS